MIFPPAGARIAFMQDREAYEDTNTGGGELPSTPDFSEEDLEFFERLEPDLIGGNRFNIFLIHATRARYVRYEADRGTRLIAVGEGPDVEAAILAVGQGKTPDRVMGDPNPTNPLDEWILRGNSINISGRERSFVVALKGQRNGSFTSSSLSRAIQEAFKTP